MRIPRPAPPGGSPSLRGLGADGGEAGVLGRDRPGPEQQLLGMAQQAEKGGVAVVAGVEQRLGDGEDPLEKGAELRAVVGARAVGPTRSTVTGTSRHARTSSFSSVAIASIAATASRCASASTGRKARPIA